MEGRDDSFLSAEGTVRWPRSHEAARPRLCLTPCKGSGSFKSLRPLEHRSYNVNLNNLEIAALLLYPPLGGMLVSLRPWLLWRTVQRKMFAALAIMLAASNRSGPLA